MITDLIHHYINLYLQIGVLFGFAQLLIRAKNEEPVTYLGGLKFYFITTLIWPYPFILMIWNWRTRKP